jgi:hypothetical protein
LAVNALSLAVCLRPWRGAGIYALLRDDEGYPASDVSVATSPGEEDGVGLGRSTKDVGMRDADAVSGGRERAVQHSASPPPDSLLSSIAQFPPPWRALLEKTRPAPLVWTYEELGSDLQGNASAERSRCLKSLIAALALPRGSSAFWPLSLPASAAGSGVRALSGPAENAGVPESAVACGTGDLMSIVGSDAGTAGICAEFAAGVRLLGAAAVMYFGTAAAMRSGFALTIRAPYTQQIAGGLQHVLLPALSALAEGPEQAEKAVVYLRSVLTDHPLLRARAAQDSAG